MPILPISFIRKFSSNEKKRTAMLFAVLFLLLLSGFVAALALGSTSLSLKSGLEAVLRGERTSASYRIFLHVRLPRALAALLAGAALAVSGTVLQAVLGNPMAAPNIIGVNAGAGLAAIVLIAIFPTAISLLPTFAFLGALGACLLIWLIAVKTGAGRVSLTLVGVAVSSILTAGINTVKTLFPSSVLDASSFLIGGLSGVSLLRLAPAAVIIATGLLLALLLSPRIDLLSLGDDTARGLGLPVLKTRFLSLVAAGALAGAAVSFAGLLGFVGLLVPHILRHFIGNRHRLLLPAAALGGGALVLWCDLASRLLFAPFELPVGILLSALGGPFFISLILWGGRRASDD